MGNYDSKKTNQALQLADEGRDVSAKSDHYGRIKVGCGEGVTIKLLLGRDKVDVTGQTLPWIVGVQVSLTAEVEATWSVKAHSWSVPEEPVARYEVGPDEGRLEPLEKLAQENVRFYWVRPRAGMQVVYTVTLGNGSRHSAEVVFDVAGPRATIEGTVRAADSVDRHVAKFSEIGYPPHPYTGDYGEVAERTEHDWPVIGANNEYDLYLRHFRRTKTNAPLIPPESYYELHFGVPVPMLGGVVLRATVEDLPAGNHTLAWFQLTDPKRKRTLKGAKQRWGRAGLDGEAPYAGERYKFSSEKVASGEERVFMVDSPALPLSQSMTYAEVADTFETWLMFKANVDKPSIWVPLSKTRWGWRASARRWIEYAEDDYEEQLLAYESRLRQKETHGPPPPLSKYLPPNPWKLLEAAVTPPVGGYDPFDDDSGLPEWNSLAQAEDWLPDK